MTKDKYERYLDTFIKYSKLSNLDWMTSIATWEFEGEKGAEEVKVIEIKVDNTIRIYDIISTENNREILEKYTKTAVCDGSLSKSLYDKLKKSHRVSKVYHTFEPLHIDGIEDGLVMRYTITYTE